MSRTWLITGVSSGFGNEMTKQLLEKGDTVIGTVRNTAKVQELIDKYKDIFDCQILDVTDIERIHTFIPEMFEKHGRIDVVVNNAGYGLFGAAEELDYENIMKILNTNLTGSIMVIRDSLPCLRRQGGGRIIQLSSYGGQVATLGMVSDNPEENYVQLPLGSTQWGDTFTEDDYRDLVAEIHSGAVTVSNDISGEPGAFGSNIEVNSYGDIK